MKRFILIFLTFFMALSASGDNVAYKDGCVRFTVITDGVIRSLIVAKAE